MARTRLWLGSLHDNLDLSALVPLFIDRRFQVCTDLAGNLRVHDTSLSFKDTVFAMIQDAQELWKERGIRSPLVVAFDRELYDTKFFAALDEIGVLHHVAEMGYDRPGGTTNRRGALPLVPRTGKSRKRGCRAVPCVAETDLHTGLFGRCDQLSFHGKSKERSGA